MHKPLNTDLQRVVVIGTSCSGKTTFARQLSDLLGVPHVELDALHWNRHWEPRARVEFLRIVEKAVARDRWVTDGNYGTTRQIVWSRATAVLWLNYSFVLVFYRALSRTLQRAATREELYSGNTESFTRLSSPATRFSCGCSLRSDVVDASTQPFFSPIASHPSPSGNFANLETPRSSSPP